MRHDDGGPPARRDALSPSVNITMVTWNRVNLTRLCLESMLASKLPNAVVHVVDNGSTDGTRQYLSDVAERNDNVKVFFLRRNYGIAVAANYGWSSADSDYYVKIDNDVKVSDENWLVDLVNFSERNKEIGMLGYRLLEKHKITPVYLPSGDLFHQFTSCGGGIVLISRNIHHRCGFWTEDYGCYGFEDLDYSNRVRMIGYRTGYHCHEKAVKHLGYEGDNVDTCQEKLKQAGIHDARKGEKLYLLNKFLFENTIRSIAAPRKFLPVHNNDEISFRLNHQYLPVIKIHNRLLREVRYTPNADGTISLDFRKFCT
jgi:glycosyltransferase involved in cell wall biosynthesis